MIRNPHGMETLVKAYRQAIHLHGHAMVELEFRLGRQGAGGFQPGVTKRTFDALQTVLSASPSFSKSTIATHERLNGTDARHVTTNGDDTSGRWMYKKKVCTECLDESLRASVSIESMKNEPPPPGSPPFTYFRAKNRTRYRWKCWSIDLTQVTSNLPRHSDNDDIYEVEVEFIDPDALFEYTVDHIVAWGAHLSREIHDLVAPA